jgi:two-component system, cell cycle sensor histidine kinase and response regulator CckA
VADLTRQIAEGHDWCGEFEDYHKDGSRIWIDARVSRIGDASGELIGIIGTSHDITARKRAEAERDQITARLRLQIDRMPLAYLLLDRDLRLADWNAAAERMFGYTRAEILGMMPPFEPLLPRSAWPVAEDILGRLRAGDMAAHATNENLTNDGRTITCEWSNTPLLDDDGVFVGVISLAQDITERRLADEALRASEERFRQIAESISEVFWLTTPDKHEIAYVSPGYETIWGRTRETVHVSPQSWMEAIHPEDRERVRQAALTNQMAGTYDEEYRIVRPDGTVRWIRDRAFPVRDRDGQVVRVAGVAEDVTERRQLEAQLRQAQKMEAIGRLAGGVAHDFNNLLTVINGCSELLLHAVGDGAEQRELLDEILKAGKRSASLTRQLLAFSRQQVVSPKILDVNEVVQDIEKMLRRLIGEDVDLTTVLQRPLPTVKADRGQLEQVLLNLAVNARDAMPDGGALTVETREVELTAGFTVSRPGVVPGRYIALAVADSGVGMPEHVKRHLFEPFFTTKDPGKGTGLGLAVVHGFVKQSGGCVEVRSEPGAGTCFTVYLPCTDGRGGSAVDVAEGASGHGTGTETILLIEDDDAVRALTKRVLQRCGYTVLEASRGTDGLRLAAAHPTPIHLLITDVVMPGIPGRTVAEQIGESHPETKVLYVSGHTNDNVRRAGVPHDAVPFLQKPFAPEAISRKVREILSS